MLQGYCKARLTQIIDEKIRLEKEIEEMRPTYMNAYNMLNNGYYTQEQKHMCDAIIKRFCSLHKKLNKVQEKYCDVYRLWTK